MKKNSMFQYLYNSILAQIRAGRYACGSPLPSAPELCRMYNVGIRTSRDVLRALRDDGYISTAERRRAVVVRAEDPGGGTRQKLAEAVARKESVPEIYDVLELLMPPLFLFCARQCGDDDFYVLDPLIKKADRARGEESWRLSSLVLHAILKKSGNPLFCDLYSSLELSAQVPRADGFKHPYDALREDDGRGFCWVMEPLRRRDYGTAEARLRLMYRSARAYAESYIAKIEAANPDIRPREREKFHWNVAKGRIYLYAEIARDIIDGIAVGRWNDGDLLPSSKELASDYGVSLYVVRQALEMLRGRGFVSIRNGCRPRVELSCVGKDISRFSEPNQKRDIWVYLCALQLMTAMLPHAAPLAARRFTDGQRRRMREVLSERGTVVPRTFMKCIFEALPGEPLRDIFNETNSLLLWGNHLMFQPAARAGLDFIEDKCAQALCALDGGSESEFAELLTETYRYSLYRLREFIAAAGMPEAGKIKIPS